MYSKGDVVVDNSLHNHSDFSHVLHVFTVNALSSQSMHAVTQLLAV